MHGTMDPRFTRDEAIHFLRELAKALPDPEYTGGMWHYDDFKRALQGKPRPDTPNKYRRDAWDEANDAFPIFEEPIFFWIGRTRFSIRCSKARLRRFANSLEKSRRKLWK